MIALGAYQKCKRYIECHSEYTDEFNRYIAKKGYFPTVTISRQTGTGAPVIGEKFIEIMNNQHTECKYEWTYFDKNLIEKVCSDYNLPVMFAKLNVEDKYSNVETVIKDLFWFNESQWTLVQKTSKTILKLAETGNVMLVGRGASIITSKLKNVLHIRLVAPLETRIKYIQETQQLSYKDAEEFIKKEEQARRNYVKSYFFKDNENPLNYHMTLNTHLLGNEGTAEIIAQAVKKRFPQIYAEAVY